MNEIEKINPVLNSPDSEICEIMIDPKQEIIPSMGFINNEDCTFYQDL